MPQLAKRRLTDRYIATRKPASKGDRDITPDADAPGMALVVTDKGHKSFVLIARYPPSRNPTKRLLGEYSKAFTLESARKKAGEWRELIRRGVDPRDAERRQREEEEERQRAEARRRDNTFGKVAEDFLQRHVKGQRRAKDTEDAIRKELIVRWGTMPLDSITRRDVIAMVEEIVDRGAPAMARNVLGNAKTLFSWAIARDKLEHSPADRVEASKLIGEKKPRERVLSDEELFAYWRAAGRLGYPFGALYRFLALTAVRKNEAAGARWREFDLEQKIWRIPPERFKSGSVHTVPLTDEAVAILETLPRFDRGDHLFSTTFGKVAVSGFSKAKLRLDRHMLRTLEAMARMRGDDPAKVKLEPFVIHDVRRTARTRLSGLRVEERVAELIIGHGKKGLSRIYDQYEFVDEMRDGLERWAARLRSIIDPPPENVFDLGKARA